MLCRYCVFKEALSPSEIAFLNGWLDGHDPAKTAQRGGQSNGPWSGNVLFNTDGQQLDAFTMHPNILGFVSKVSTRADP